MIPQQLDLTRHKIKQYAERYHRQPNDINLIAVSKQQTSSAIIEAILHGQHDFGESYLQEALAKIKAINHPGVCWHFIGPIQSNKTREIAEHFHWVHSIERLKIAERLNAQRPLHLPPLNICIEVNIDNELSKSGIKPTELFALATAIVKLPNLTLRGLMAIPKPQQQLSAQRLAFARLRELLQDLNQQGFKLDTLSIGMSDDLEAAIAEGATCVRIGRAIFGSR